MTFKCKNGPKIFFVIIKDNIFGEPKPPKMPQALKSPEVFAQELITKFGKQSPVVVDTISEFIKNHSSESEFVWLYKNYFNQVKAIINENI